MILSTGNFSPIVPVHANIISFGLIFFGQSSSIICLSDKFLDKSKDNSFKDLKPFDPVNAFAFLVLTKRAVNFLESIFWFHFMFSEIILDCVKTDA